MSLEDRAILKDVYEGELVGGIRGSNLNVNQRVTPKWNIGKSNSAKSCCRPRVQQNLVFSAAVYDVIVVS